MDLRRSIYRSRALLRRRQAERLDDALRVTAPHEWVILCAIGAILLSGAAWALLGKIEQHVTAPAAIIVSGDRRDVVSGVTGTVLKVSVGVGDQVMVGDAIAEIAMAGEVPTAELMGPLDAVLPGDLRRRVIEVIETSLGYRGSSPGLYQMLSPASGEVTSLRLEPGLIVSTGLQVAQITSTSNPRFEVLAYVPWDESTQIIAGMEARVLVDSPESSTHETLRATIREVSTRPESPPAWLADLELSPALAQPMRMVRAGLAQPLGDWVVDRTECRLQVPTGSTSSLSILVPGGPQ